MKSFFLKQRLNGDDFENDFGTFFPPVNEGVDELAFALSEFVITIVNQQAKRKNKQSIKDRLHLIFFQEFKERL